MNAALRALARQRASIALPCKSADLVTYLTVAQSHPRWLVERWLARDGPERTEAMCCANNILPPLAVRANRLRATREQLIESLTAEGCHVEPSRLAPDAVVIHAHPPLDHVRCYAEGWFYVQDEAATLSGYLLTPQPGERVLDACAAPWGKVTHLAELMGDTGEIVALDQSSHRLRLLTANCQRLGLRSIRSLVGDATQIALDRPFDRILVDAPCSGMGVLRRHPDAKWRKGPALIDAMQRQQSAILEHVSRFLKPGAVLVYATCSTEPEENQDVVQAFLTRHPEYQLEPVAAYLPANARMFAHDGGYFQTWPGPEGLDGAFGVRLRRD
ncbi:MAG: 16S rRNA (cytosine(967)-C(5))-methyltransferase RsmB [Nitrospinae bacterium]|nr:16S rRNA (cytosine(967)-C(5))-methyltransferase RsmB [Nitrospinota bacterium]